MSLAILFSLFAQIENWKRDLTTNHAKLDPDSRDPLLRPLVLTHEVAEVAAIIQRWADAQPLWSVESLQQTDSGIKIHLVHRTKILRFADDIRVRLVADKGATRVEAESQSRFGVGDLGQNPRNLRELAGALAKHR